MNPDRPLQDRAYQEVVNLELSVAQLESRSLHDYLNKNNTPEVRARSCELWKTVCSAHDKLLEELDRRELHYQDG